MHMLDNTVNLYLPENLRCLKLCLIATPIKSLPPKPATLTAAKCEAFDLLKKNDLIKQQVSSFDSYH